LLNLAYDFLSNEDCQDRNSELFKIEIVNYYSPAAKII